MKICGGISRCQTPDVDMAFKVVVDPRRDRISGMEAARVVSRQALTAWSLVHHSNPSYTSLLQAAHLRVTMSIHICSKRANQLTNKIVH